jgi:site-specific recombinase XerD
MQSTTIQITSLNNFVAYLRKQDRALKTIQGYVSDLGSFARWFHQINGEKLTDKNLTDTDVRLYRQWLVERDAAPSTVNRHLATLRVYAEWIGIPVTVKGVEEQSLAPRWLDKKEQAALVRETEKVINAAQTQAAKIQGLRDRAVIVILLNCGLRISELCDLSINDVELSDRKGKLIVRQGKGSKKREVPLNGPAREALKNWMKVRVKGDALFAGKRGNRLSPSGAYRRLTELARRASIKDVSPHTLRHSFGKNLVDSGVGIERVAALLGHSNLNTTRIYTTPSARDLENAVEKLE